MITSLIFRQRVKMIAKSLFFIYILFITTAVFAQSVPDFSGTWIQDNAKSSDFYKKLNVTTIISQTPVTISIKTTFFDNNGKEIVTRESQFNLNGKEEISDKGRAKKSAAWSADKKTLTTTDTKEYGGGPVGVKISYTLSDNGRVLTANSKDINPMIDPVTQVFNKKK
jgi:hypothetical protein